MGEPQTMKILRVRGWDRHYENNRTREMKRMVWIPVTTRLDSDGYTELMGMKNGAAHFGCWIAILEVASQCSPRGMLVRTDSRPHDAASLARLTRIDHRTMRAAVVALTRIKWLEEVDVPAGSPQRDRGLPAAKLPSQEGRKEGREGGCGTDAADGPGRTPPAAGTEKRPRKPRDPLPPEVLANLERLRLLRESGALDPGKPRAVGCSAPFSPGATRSPPAWHRPAISIGEDHG